MIATQCYLKQDWSNIWYKIIKSYIQVISFLWKYSNNSNVVFPIYQGYGSRLDRRDQKMGHGSKIFWFSQNILTLLDIVCMQTGIKKLSMKPDKNKCCSILDNIICYKLDLLLTGLAEPGGSGANTIIIVKYLDLPPSLLHLWSQKKL